MQTASILVQPQPSPPFSGSRYLEYRKQESSLGNSNAQRITLGRLGAGVGRERVRLPLLRTAAAGGNVLDPAERARLEFRWLAENAERYTGRWVALDGDRLLAAGASAREVYAAIGDHEGTPLVTRVEPIDGTYFAGW